MRYARWEHERRWVLRDLPEGLTQAAQIEDHYLRGLRLRLRRIRHEEGRIEHKLGQKFRPEEEAGAHRHMTTLYLEPHEYAELAARLGATQRTPLRKVRYRWPTLGPLWVVDRFEAPFEGLLLAEVEAEREVLESITAPPGAVREGTEDRGLDGGVLAALVGGVEEQGVRVVPLVDRPGDFALLGRWLSDERVLARYGGLSSGLDAVSARHKYLPFVRRHEEVVPCLIHEGDEALGYLQFYSVLDAAAYQLDAEPLRFGLDLFVGEPESWGRGIARRAIRAVCAMLEDVAGAREIVIDPAVDNEAAIRCYRAAGFEAVKVLHRHEEHDGVWQDCQLMRRRGPGGEQ